MLGCRTRPQLGGRAGASGAYEGNDGIATVLLEEARHRGDQLPLLGAVQVAEHFVGDEPDAGKARGQLLAQYGKYLVAVEYIVPELADGLAAQVGAALIRGARIET